MDQDAIFDLGHFEDRNVELDVAPETASHYLQQVHVQRKQVQQVVVASHIPASNTAHTQLTAHLHTLTHNTGNVPVPVQWQDLQLANFSDVRCALRTKRKELLESAQSDSSLDIDIPHVDGANEWDLFAARTLADPDQDKHNEDHPLYLPPSPRLVSRFSDPVIAELITLHVESFVEQGYSTHRVHWLYSLLCVLQKPVEPSTCASLRQLARNCTLLRQTLNNTDSDNDMNMHRQLSLIILIVARLIDKDDSLATLKRNGIKAQTRMFSSSTQLRCWTFESREQLAELRAKARQEFMCKYNAINAERQCFLTDNEEAQLVQLVMQTGHRFSQQFKPSMWSSVVWTAFTLVRRFYLHQSPMEYVCKNVIMASFYLACKIDEFNVSIDEFVANLKSGDSQNNMETILSLEPVLMSKLKFQLTVHCPYRPFEGHMIALKTLKSAAVDYEIYRAECDTFLEKTLLSEAMLIFSPSQIALSALYHTIHPKQASAIVPYIQVQCGHDHTKTLNLTACLQSIIQMVQQVQPVSEKEKEHLSNRAQSWVVAKRALDLQLSELNKQTVQGSDHTKTNQWDDDEDD